MLAGGTAVAAVALYDDPPTNENVPPDLVVTRAEPPFGSTVSLSRDRVSLVLRVTLRRQMGRGTITLRVQGAPGFNCLLYQGTHETIPAETPVDLPVDSVLSTSLCRTPGEVNRGILTLQENLDEVGPGVTIEFPMAYSFVP